MNKKPVGKTIDEMAARAAYSLAKKGVQIADRKVRSTLRPAVRRVRK